jgi:hypothetical protein
MILFILSVIGLTLIVVDSDMMDSPQKWIKSWWPAFGDMMDCHQCAGFWCGAALSPLIANDALSCFAAACAGSFLAQLGYWILDILEVIVKAVR